MMKDLLYLGIWNYWRCMHSVLIRNYKYKYSREGIIPGSWYNDFLLDPCSVSLGHFAIDPNIMKVNAIVTGLQDQDGKEEYDDEFFKSYYDKKISWLFTLDEDIPVWTPEKIKESFITHSGSNVLIVTRHSTLIIDGTEYNNQYVQDHLNDLRILLDQIRTDMLLEDMDV